MREQADQELVERARTGDPEAMGELFSKYWRAARAVAFGVTGEYGSAEDAASEGFRQALAGLGALKDPSRFGPWLKTIVVRKARLGLRIRQGVTDVLPDSMPDTKERPDSTLQRIELEVLIQRSVRELPPRLREAVSLYYMEGYDVQAAADFLDIPSGTFRRRLHEGRNRLRIAAKTILEGNTLVNEDREREIENLKGLIENAEGDGLYLAMRGMLSLRPSADELIGTFIERQKKDALSDPSNGRDFKERVRAMAQRFGTPSEDVLDPNHPVGAVAAAIRQALPDFKEWRLDLGEAAASFLAPNSDHRSRLESVLPPGFAQGREGAFIRATRALLLPGEDGGARTTYQIVQDSKDPQDFRASISKVAMSDVLDLTWMAEGRLELLSVQNLLEHLCAVVLPGLSIRFTSYDEPRYRSALQLRAGEIQAPAAIGGVLAEWPGRPNGVDAAHVRIFLEPWASAKSGSPVEFQGIDRLKQSE